MPFDVAELEDVAARAVPAAEVTEVGGWLLRATPGVRARRANSVLARGDEPEPGLESRIETVRRFYADRGSAARFQLTPASRPAGLERELLARGYVRESPTRVLVGAAATAAEGRVAPDVHVRIADAADETWLATWAGALGRDRAAVAGPAALWARIDRDLACATVTVDGEPAGVGMAVGDGRWLGVFNMATHPGARRRGAARAALRALSEWGLARGARTVYLQVDAANVPARTLYRAAGLGDAYGYAYLTHETR